MGRTKTYERETLIDRAVEVFRSHGFASTSASMLEERLGVNRSSIYAEFGSKQGLFHAALERYRETVVDQRFAPLLEPGAGIEAIMAVFDFYGAAGVGPAAGRGCLLCNTAIELGPDDPIGTRAVPRYLDRISSAFEFALDDAVRQAEIHASVDTTQEAQFLTATVLGIFVMLRAGAPPAVISAAATAAKRHVASLEPSGDDAHH
jgi:TetR/AcrR family transcriptional repressor of nem operon